MNVSNFYTTIGGHLKSIHDVIFKCPFYSSPHDRITVICNVNVARIGTMFEGTLLV